MRLFSFLGLLLLLLCCVPMHAEESTDVQKAMTVLESKRSDAFETVVAAIQKLEKEWSGQSKQITLAPRYVQLLKQLSEIGDPRGIPILAERFTLQPMAIGNLIVPANERYAAAVALANFGVQALPAAMAATLANPKDKDLQTALAVFLRTAFPNDLPEHFLQGKIATEENAVKKQCLEGTLDLLKRIPWKTAKK